ncbi:PAS domain S-box protein [Natronobiforma cellulositropha]|uniref:PAS domain S-box protein n=1 Tax=Natronobiforma cellulositropha TaxID=1679076 RepID=UPI0021D5CA28|nr:PAS domain S-box protein [Natronobiforma cellulositropha]
MSDRVRNADGRAQSEVCEGGAGRDYHTLVDAVDDGLYQLDADGYFVTVNDAIVERSGYARSELIGEHVSVLLEPATIDRIETEIQRRLTGERETDRIEFVLEAATGEVVACELTISLLVDDGTFRGTAGVVREITDRSGRDRVREQWERRTEQVRRRERCEAILETIDDGVYVLDADRRFTMVNDGFASLARVDRSDLVGRHVSTVFGTEFDALERAHATGEESSAAPFEGTIHRGDGEELVVENRSTVLTSGPLEGERIGVVRDISGRKARERTLEESEQRYRTLAEYFPNGIVTLFDHDLRYTLASGQGFAKIPVEAADLEGRHFRDVWPPETADELEPIFLAALAGTERSVELEYAGREWVVRAVPITDERGDTFAGMTMAQDITVQKDRERYLRDAKAKLEAATEAGAIGTWEWDIEADRMVVGTSFADTFGVDPDAAETGVPLEQFIASIHPADRERVVASVERAVETGGAYEEEYRVRDADGDLRWVVARSSVTYDDAGDPQTFPGALVDITDRKNAEEELKHHKRQLETLFEVLPVGAVVARADGYLVEANETATEIWGGDVFDAEAVSEYDRYTAWWPESGDRVQPDEWTMAQVLRGEEVTEPNVYEIEAVDGTRKIIMEHGMPVRDDDGDVQLGVVTLSDITERREYRRRLETAVSKLEASNERLEQFAYAASHDLQEPLRMVSSYLQLVDSRYRSDLDEEGREFLAFAIDGADRMREMVDGLLEYARVDTRGDPLEPVDLESVFDAVVGDLAVGIDESGAVVTSESLPCVYGDANQLRQVFQNLLSNAITYAGDEPPRIHVSAERHRSEWLLSVQDDGIGIDPADEDQVFEIFQRLHSRDEFDGSGIGLALCKRIVERHGGEIWVDSAPGEGATFSFTLPAVDDDQ